MIHGFIGKAATETTMPPVVEAQHVVACSTQNAILLLLLRQYDKLNRNQILHAYVKNTVTRCNDTEEIFLPREI